MESCQAILTRYLAVEQHEVFRNKLVGTLVNFGAWFTSLQSPDAGRWLTLCPKKPEFKFVNADYEISIRRRLFLPIPRIIPGTLCNCNLTPKVRLDLLGHHLVSACGIKKLVSHQHDEVANTIGGMASFCGFRNLREELACFKEADPDNNKRPDLSILRPPRMEEIVVVEGRDPKLILDVQITNPVPGSKKGVFLGMSLGASRKEGLAAGKAFNAKNRKYKGIASENGLSFLPLIFETTGRPHDKVMEFVKKLAHNAEEIKRIDKSIIYAYVMNRLSCTLQKSIAHTIITRMNGINCRTTLAAGGQHSDTFVSTHESRTFPFGWTQWTSRLDVFR